MTSPVPLIFRALRALDGPWGSWGSVATHVAELGCAARAGTSLVRYLAAEPSLSLARARVELGGRDYLDPAMETRDDVPFHLAAAAVCDASEKGGFGATAPGLPGIYVAQSPTPPELDALCVGLSPLLRGRDSYGRNVWLGPTGTVTPLHRDPNANLLAQVVGRKRVILHHPEACVYPRATAPYTNASAADAEAPDRATFPDFPRAYGTVELGPGDALLIPVGWWHHVRCTAGPSLSLNYWFR